MKRIGVGVLIGIVLTIGGQHIWKVYQAQKYKDTFVLFDLAKYDVQQKLPGSRVLDVSVSPSKKAKVNFAYDKLYDVHLSYERKGEIKGFIAQYAIYRGTWIGPSSTEIEILDDKAKVIHSKKTANMKN